MIVTRITSGLGNQLFQLAAGLALSRLRKTELRLDLAWFERKRHEPHEIFQLEPYAADMLRASRDDLSRVPGLGRSFSGRIDAALRRWRQEFCGSAAACAPLVRATDGDFSFSPAFRELPADTYLAGNWQSALFFENVADEMRERLRRYVPNSPSVAQLAAEIDAAPSAFLHVRRGDYVSNPHYQRELGPLESRYYTAACAALKSAVGACRLYAFTNDTEWARDCLLPDTRIVGPAEVASPHDLLHLMSRCRHAIMANSSLSWWAAWREWWPGKFIYAPRPWFAESWRNTRDLIPAGWRQIDR